MQGRRAAIDETPPNIGNYFTLGRSFSLLPQQALHPYSIANEGIVLQVRHLQRVSFVHGYNGICRSPQGLFTLVAFRLESLFFGSILDSIVKC